MKKLLYLSLILTLSSCFTKNDDGSYQYENTTFINSKENMEWVNLGGTDLITVWKIQIDSTEYILVDGYHSVAIIKHK